MDSEFGAVDVSTNQTGEHREMHERWAKQAIGFQEGWCSETREEKKRRPYNSTRKGRDNVTEMETVEAISTETVEKRITRRDFVSSIDRGEASCHCSDSDLAALY
jgi:hypothetical protein